MPAFLAGAVVALWLQNAQLTSQTAKAASTGLPLFMVSARCHQLHDDLTVPGLRLGDGRDRHDQLLLVWHYPNRLRARSDCRQALSP